jgi:hypothetical protein
MNTTPTKASELPDADVDVLIDAVLTASGSGMRHFTMQRTIDRMREAMRSVVAKAASKQVDLTGLVRYSAVTPMDAYGNHDGLEPDDEGAYVRLADVQALLSVKP